MNTPKARQSTPDQGPGPHSTPGISLATAAITFTIIVVQVQAYFHGSTRDLLPILIAALLAAAGAAASGHQER